MTGKSHAHRDHSQPDSCGFRSVCVPVVVRASIYLPVQSRIFGSCSSIYWYPLSYGTPKSYWIEMKICVCTTRPHTKLEVRGRFKFGYLHQGIYTPKPSHAGYPRSMSNSWPSYEGIVQRNISHKYAYRRKMIRGCFRLCFGG